MAFVKTALAGLLACACACAAVAAADPAYSIDAHVVGAGSSARAGSACFRLRATIGEPVAAFASSADYAIAGGFRASARGADDIFFSGCASSPYATGDAIIGFNPGDVVQISNLGGTRRRFRRASTTHR